MIRFALCYPVSGRWPNAQSETPPDRSQARRQQVTALDPSLCRRLAAECREDDDRMALALVFSSVRSA